jgi:hypothetical protein
MFFIDRRKALSEQELEYREYKPGQVIFAQGEMGEEPDRRRHAEHADAASQERERRDDEEDALSPAHILRDVPAGLLSTLSLVYPGTGHRAVSGTHFRTQRMMPG